MVLSPTEFIQKEFEELTDLTQEDWLRKMVEYSVIQNSKVNLDFIVGLQYEKNKTILPALNAAVSAINFADNNNYVPALYDVVSHLGKIDFKDMDYTKAHEIVSSIYYLLNPKF
jgi:hypothetical protein